jgi:hypothetical protein
MIATTGPSKEATVEALQTQLESESRRLISWTLPETPDEQFSAAD